MITLELHMERWQLSDALQHLIADHQGPFPEEKILRKTYLREHPFGLWVPTSPRGLQRSIKLLESPGSTAPSVRAMAAVLGAMLRFAGRESLETYYLRVIECVERKLDDGTVHCNLYYEAGSLGSVFIVGGVNDYSGTGGAGGRELKHMFEIVGAVFGFSIERVRFEQPFARMREERLMAEFNEQLLRQ